MKLGAIEEEEKVREPRKSCGGREAEKVPGKRRDRSVERGGFRGSFARCAPREKLVCCGGRKRGKRSLVRSRKRRKRMSLENRATAGKRRGFRESAEIGPSKEEGSGEACSLRGRSLLVAVGGR